MNPLNSTSVGQSGVCGEAPLGRFRAHPALPKSQQMRINAWIDARPVGSFQSDDMPHLIELARAMDRAERIANQIDETSVNDVCVRQSLEDLIAAEFARIHSLNSHLQLLVDSTLGQAKS